MAVGSESMQGARLEFVLRELPGTVLARKIKPPPSKRQKDANPELEGQSSNVINMERVPAGFMVFFPNGSCYRLSAEEAKRRGLTRAPAILNLESVKDTESPAGRFKYSVEEADKRKAYRDMENELIRRCTGRVGNIEGMIGPECEYDPKGKIAEKKVA